MSYKYSDSVSSCCGLQSSSTIDLVNWQEVRAHNTSWSPNTHTHTFPFITLELLDTRRLKKKKQDN